MEFVLCMLCMLKSCILATQVQFRQNEYVVLQTGSSVTGSSIALHQGTNAIQCSIRCVTNMKCELFQHPGTGRGSCTLMSSNGGDTFIGVEHNLIYNTVIPERSWPDGIEPVLYFGFDTLTNLQLKEGSVDGHFSAVVSGKLNKAIRLDHTQSQWVDLGDLSIACITRPDTCGSEGGAVSFWLNLIDCPSWGRIISSRTYQHEGGFNIFCVNTNIRYELQLPDGKLQGQGPQPSSEWTHVILNYLGSSAGTKLYYNGVYRFGNIPKFGDTYTPGNGRTVVGERNVNLDSSYASLEIDDLAMFNATLSDIQIGELFNSL